jgi:hypothetical protein
LPSHSFDELDDDAACALGRREAPGPTEAIREREPAAFVDVVAGDGLDRRLLARRPSLERMLPRALPNRRCPGSARGRERPAVAGG